MAKEDQQQAVGIVTTLSGQLMTAALGMIALLGALLTFVLDKKDCGLWFWIAALLSFAVFVLSLVCGGFGTTALYKAGASGDWNYSKGDAWFQGQTALSFAGIVLFIVAVWLSGNDKTSDSVALQREVAGVRAALEKQNSLIEGLLNTQRQPTVASPTLDAFNKMKSEVDELRKTLNSQAMKPVSPSSPKGTPIPPPKP